MRDDTKITLAHGSGGRLTHDLIKEVFVKNFSNNRLNELGDSAVLKIAGNRFAFTTDSFVVDPIFFPGGDIGSLAVHGTINDLAVTGAKPLYLSCGILIEEGFLKRDLEKVTASMKKAAKKAKVEIVTGDTKVVEKGALDKLFINTSGIGIIEGKTSYSTTKIKPGDLILVTGTIGDHGAAILTKRRGLGFQTSIKSDSASLYALLRKLKRFKDDIRFMRDPTRGGIATTLNEISQTIPYGIEIEENELPFKKETRSLAEILGMDPLYFPNEGMSLIVSSERSSRKVLQALKKDGLGKKASIIGRVIKERKNQVVLKNSYGGLRLIEMLSGEQLPRIC